MGSLSPPQRQSYGKERQRKNKGGGGVADERRWQLTKVLFNVSMQNSLWPVQVMMSPENTVRELVKAAICVFAEEKQRPELRCADPGSYQLHYSQFSLESEFSNFVIFNLVTSLDINYFISINKMKDKFVPKV